MLQCSIGCENYYEAHLNITVKIQPQGNFQAVKYIRDFGYSIADAETFLARDEFTEAQQSTFM